MVQANFTSGTTNQKHHPDLGSDTSSVWNFCARFSDVISLENRRWRREMSAVFSGYLKLHFSNHNICFNDMEISAHVFSPDLSRLKLQKLLQTSFTARRDLSRRTCWVVSLKLTFNARKFPSLTTSINSAHNKEFGFFSVRKKTVGQRNKTKVTIGGGGGGCRDVRSLRFLGGGDSLPRLGAKNHKDKLDN